ncbi:hypothetical protein CYMTET_43142 [Cymbomonas tetramitiformis]|uniref:Uncharacterized protein n=1 Tax=Cymbomonas tetramitiformis TaxID=36881 RepID=A0AAE0F1Y0_9CHLO|nr:hypothetical protein CYMTET_43142 [Cymbomonas tetramitiformis]
MGYQGQITMGILSVSQWCSGHTFFVQQMHLAKKVEPYVVHATFQFAGTEGKRHRFREAKLWIDPPDYYNPPRGVVTYVNDVPADLLHRAATEYNGKLDSSAAHFELVHHQLQQLRNALGVALALGRHLVLPKLMCGIDRVWFPHRGIFPGSQLKLPFQCPVDHVIEIQAFVATRPAYPVLEHSFLENPRTPDTLKNSVKDLTLGVDLTMNATDVQIQTLLKGHENAKVLQFDSLVGQVFAGFEDKTKNDEFQMRLKRATGIWGTAMSRPGHVHYDFFADVAPWKDRHMRSRSKPWSLVGGEQPFPE